MEELNTKNINFYNKTFFTMLYKVAGMGCSFLFSMLLARNYAVSSYGYYAFGFSIAQVASVLLIMGASGILVRSWGWSSLTGYERNQEAYQIYNWYFKRGLVLIIIAVCLLWLCNTYMKRINQIEFISFLFVIPFYLSLMLQNFYVAIRKVTVANIIQIFVRGSMLLYFVAMYYLLSNRNIVIQNVLLGTQIIAVIFLGALSVILFFRYGFKTKHPGKGNGAFMLVQAGNILLSQLDIVLVKMFSTSEQVAFYSVALQYVLVLQFVLAAVNSNISSYIAEAFKKLPLGEFNRELRKFSLITLRVSLFVATCLLIASHWIFLLYGKAYQQGANDLFLILLLGQVIYMLCGNVGVVLGMVGGERYLVISSWAAFAVNIILGAVAGYFFGVYGIALASTVSTMFLGVIMSYFSIRRLNINSSAFKWVNAIMTISDSLVKT